ncbi:hypothetical protein ACFY1L_46680 [Streptomyces sp. NPDC001663]|uniref:hypothetical protein n=1 Tax=Streptomyces sp. NPDC001663 TaxID=3364597 RepID=UPI00369B427E
MPFDEADAAARARYRNYAASRHERTLTPQTLAVLGPKRFLFAPDVVGTAEQILEQPAADPVLAQAPELRLELPYELHREEYEQILHDVRQLIAPELGWRPASPAVQGSGQTVLFRSARSGWRCTHARRRGPPLPPRRGVRGAHLHRPLRRGSDGTRQPLDLVPPDGTGKVRFSADVEILRPVEDGRRRLLFD